MDEKENLLECLKFVRASGQANMFDRRDVARILGNFGYNEEHKVVKNMSPSQYINLLSGDFEQYLENHGKNN